MFDLSLPNFYGSLGAVTVAAVAVKAWTLAEGGYSLALGHFGFWWTGAGILGVVLLGLSALLLVRRRMPSNTPRPISIQPGTVAPTQTNVESQRFPPRLRVRLYHSFEPHGSYIVGFIENIGGETARDVRLWLPKVPRDGQFDIKPGKRKELRFEWLRGRDDHIGGDYKQEARIEFQGDSAIYQQRPIARMPLDVSMTHRTYTIEDESIPTVIQAYTFTI
jgi:hypothetical protein